MKTAARAAFDPWGEQQADARPVPVSLASLQAAHRALADCVDRLEMLVTSADPNDAAFCSARLMLSRASYARRQIVRTACAYLAREASSDELARIRSLQNDELDYIRHSTAHVQRWSAGEAARDWPAYQQASRVMRAKLRESIRKEQRLLYPLLSRCRPY